MVTKHVLLTYKLIFIPLHRDHFEDDLAGISIHMDLTFVYITGTRGAKKPSPEMQPCFYLNMDENSK
jgi:hypothetical protein